MNGFVSLYGLGLLIALMASCALLYKRTRALGLHMAGFACVMLLAAALGFLCARLNAIPFGGWRYELVGFASPEPIDYSAFGACMGALAGVALAAGLQRRSIPEALDAFAPAGLLALAVARAAEAFADFGWGQVLFDSPFAFFPLAVPDAYGQMHLAVFLWEALAAAVVCAVSLKAKPRRAGLLTVRALLLLGGSQILLESLRAETLRLGFVRVQQVEWMLLMLAVMGWCLRQDRTALVRGVCALLGATLAVGLGEFALDKLSFIPAPVTYAVMAAAMILAVRSVWKRIQREPSFP